MISMGIKRATGCSRVFVTVIGIDVPHAHVHLIPSTDSLPDMPLPPVIEQSQAELAEVAAGIAAAVTRRRPEARPEEEPLD